MRESLILFIAVVALAIPALAVAPLLIAYKAARRLDDMERRLHDLARELRATQPMSRESSESEDRDESGAVPGARGSDSAAGNGDTERRNYSFSFLEEEPEWEKAQPAGGEGEKPETPDRAAPRKQTEPGAGNRSRRRRGKRGKRGGRG